jgi:hypothetical protein
MSERTISRKAVTTTGVAMILVGALLIGGVAVAAGAKTASGPSITVTPHARLTAAKHVVVSGLGFTHGSNGAIVECNPTPGEPAIVVPIHGASHLLPVGCSAPLAARTTSFGTLRARTLPVLVGTLGAWESGTDSAGNPAAADSAAYPCPPTAAQRALDIFCDVEFIDNKGQVASRSISFKGAPTTTTIPTTTSTTISPACDPRPATATGSPPNVSATMTVDPATCLVNGSVVTVTATGLVAKSGVNVVGTLLECNSDPNQPTVSLLGHNLPVSCTGALAHSFTPDADGTFSGPLPIVEGVTGPPVQGIDSSGNEANVDAANYPCPPTAVQVAAGDTCDISLGDEGGDNVVVPIAFNPGSTTTTTSTTIPACDPQSVTVTAAPPDGSATVTVAPGTCLLNGSEVSISGTGLIPGGADNTLGAVLECNSDPNQPTVSELGSALPVSCTGALAHSFIPDANGTFNGTFPIVEGVTGPPADGTDSSGGQAATDAASYPCPPTPAQVAAGDTCDVVVSDSGGDHDVVPISFNPNVPPPTSGRRT